MIRTTVRIDWDENIEEKAMNAVAKAQVVLDEQVLKDSNFFIPKDTGQAEDSGVIASQIGKGEIIWDTPYIRKIYYGVNINFHHDMNPNAQALWFEVAKSRFVTDWVKAAGKEVGDNL